MVVYPGGGGLVTCLLPRGRRKGGNGGGRAMKVTNSPRLSGMDSVDGMVLRRVKVGHHMRHWFRVLSLNGRRGTGPSYCDGKHVRTPALSEYTFQGAGSEAIESRQGWRPLSHFGLNGHEEQNPQPHSTPGWIRTPNYQLSFGVCAQISCTCGFPLIKRSHLYPDYQQAPPSIAPTHPQSPTSNL